MSTSITVTSPIAGQVVAGGQPLTVQWTTSGSAPAFFAVRYAADGATFTDVSPAGDLAGTASSFTFTPPNPTSTTSVAVVRVAAKDSSHAQFAKGDSGAFTVQHVAPPPTITVTSPIAGQVVTGGQPLTVQWTTSGSAPAFFAVRYAADGATFTDVSPAGDLGGTASSFTFTPPNPTSTTSVAVVRVAAKDSSHTQFAKGDSGAFTVQHVAPPPTITVTSPIAGQVVAGGQPLTVQWTTSGSAPAFFAVRYAADGATFTDVSPAGDLAGTASSFTFTPPNPTSTTSVAVIRVAAKDSSHTQFAKGDTGAFTVQHVAPPPTITVTSPIAGQVVAGGQPLTVQWTTSGSAPAFFAVRYAADGATFTDVSPAGDLGGTASSFTFTPPNPTSTTSVAVVRVAAKDSSHTQFAKGDSGAFTVQHVAPPPTITVTSPIAGQVVAGGQPLTVQWTTSGSAPAFFAVRYAADGATFTDVSPAGDLAGTASSFTFTPPNPTSTTSVAVIRVAAKDSSHTQFAKGDTGAFTVQHVAPPPTITVTSPIAGQVVAGGQPLTVQWTTSGSAPAFFAVRYAADGATFTDVSPAGDLAGTASSFTFTPPNPTSTTSVAVIRVAAKDSSHTQFAKGDSGAFTMQHVAPPGGLAVSSVSPARGPVSGGTTLMVMGQGFVKGCQVTLGGTQATTTSFVSATQLQVVTPARATADLVNVRVANPDQTVAALPSAFQYDALPGVLQVSPSAGPAAQDPTKPQIVTIKGTGFLAPDPSLPGQPLQVLFGTTPSPSVTFVDAMTITAAVPAGMAGAVTVKVINPDGGAGKLQNAFTYLGPKAATQARVLKASPINILDGEKSTLTIEGLNLIDAFDHGLLAFRAPSRVTFTRLTDVAEKHDDASLQDTLTFDVKATASPPLAPGEMVVVQVIASRRPKADVKKDRLVSTSRVTFNILARAIPVPIAFNASLHAGSPSMLVVAGVNLAGTTLHLAGASGEVEVSYQRSTHGVVAGMVHVDPAAKGPLTLSLLDAGNKTVWSQALTLAPPPTTPTPSAATLDPADPGLSLTPVGGRKVIAPTRQNSRAFDVNTQDVFDGTPLDTGLSIKVATFTLVVPLLDESLLFSFFDGGGQALVDAPRVAAVGRIFGDRAVTLLLVLRVDLTITFEVDLFIGVNPFPDFPSADPFNEFSDEPPPPDVDPTDIFGSLVTEIRVGATVDLQIRFVIALAYPMGLPPDARMALRIIAALALDLSVTVDSRGGKLDLGAGRSLRVQLGPNRIRPLAIRPKYGLALSLLSDQAYRDPLDIGLFGYFFAPQEGDYCLDWDFDVQLFAETSDGANSDPLQGEFFPANCLTVRHNDNLRVFRIDPPALDFGQPGQMMDVRAFATPVDASGKPTGAEVKLAAADVVFERDPDSPDAPDHVFEVVPPDPQIPMAEWQVRSTKVGGGVLRLLVATSGAPGLGVLPDVVLGFSLAGFLSDDVPGPTSEPGGKNRPRAAVKRANVDTGCSTRLDVIPFDCRKRLSDVGVMVSEIGGIRLRPQTGPDGAPTGGPDPVVIVYSSLTKTPKGQVFVNRVQPDQLVVRPDDPITFPSSGGTGCQDITGSIELFTVPADVARARVAQAAQMVSLDDYLGVSRPGFTALRFDSLPSPPLDLRPFAKREIYEATLEADVTVKNGRISRVVSLSVLDAELTAASYLFGALKGNIDFYGSFKQGRITFRQLSGLLGFNGARVLFDVYHQAAIQRAATFGNPVWTASISAVLAEQYYDNVVIRTQATRTPAWQEFFATNDLDLTEGTLGLDDLLPAKHLGTLFGNAHLGAGDPDTGLARAIRSANEAFGRSPCCGPDIVMVATQLVQAQVGILTEVTRLGPLLARSLVALFTPLLGTPGGIFRTQLRDQFIAALQAANETAAAAYFKSHFK